MQAKRFLIAPQQHAHPTPTSTADRLLAAAEQIVLQEGSHAVSIRRIAAVSGLNSALVSYHFGGLSALLGQLLERTVNAICDVRAAMQAEALREPDAALRLRALVIAYLDPLWRTTALWHPESARTVARELMLMLDKPLLKAAVERINLSLEASVDQMADLLPHLDHDALLMRLRLLAGTADMMRLRVDEMGLYRSQTTQAGRYYDALQTQLIELSLGALRTP
jgi:AcrR family transcriptional regulator